uniref:Secreted protein n=1 Tax=Parasteatoda tepidariorum TaxID=114398 RepID=A0A2L2YJP4_PARTP
MVAPSLFWIVLIFLCSILQVSYAVDCFTCSVDFRSQPFEQNNSCLFPTKDNEKTRCSDSSKFCQGVVTRINGVFVQLQRTCETDCTQICVEKGFGVETSECKFCCNKNPDCGKDGYVVV